MPAANESQGLKIAVAAFVSLSVVLAVTSYFMFSNYQQAAADATDAKTKMKTAMDTANQATTDFRGSRDIMGYSKLEEFNALKTEYDKNQAKWKSDLEAMKGDIDALVKKAQDRGLTDKDVAALRDQAVLAIEGVNNEANGTLRTKIDRLIEELRTETQLLDSVVIDNVGLRTSLEGVNAANQDKLKVAEDRAAKAEADLQDQQQKHEADRQTQLTTLDGYQTTNRDQANALAKANADLTQTREANARERSQLLAQIIDLRNQVARAAGSESINPSAGHGVITFVDYTRMEVRTNLTRAMGARPLMKFGVFEATATGLISDRPKDTIQLISVGETDSVARITPRTGVNRIQQTVPVNPIRVGDLVYSPVFTPYQATKIALIGKIDMNQDGRDDREDLKRMIRAAGGQVVYDLPPPGAGTESGDLTAQTTGYVQDVRPPIGLTARQTRNELTAEYKDFTDRQTKALAKATELGIPPIPIARLLNSLGYAPGSLLPNVGHVEAFDPRASESVTNPGGVRGTMPVRTTPPAEAAPKPEEAPKEEEAAPM